MVKKALALTFVLTLGFSQMLRAAPESDLTSWLTSMVSRVAAVAEEKLAQRDSQVPVAAAGLRGSEQSKQSMEPYWKGELTTRSPDYQAYHQIELKMQEGRYTDSLNLIQAFQQKFPKSRLIPEVRFTAGLAYAGLGQSKPALAAFEDVVKQYPNHELAEPSRQGIARLKKT